MNARHFDFVALGGGSAGFNAARIARTFAERVAVIDGAAELGGLCILRGCMPSKTLIHVADVQHHAGRAGGLGLRIVAEAPDMRAVHARKRRIIGEFAEHRERQLRSGDFELIRARARFTGPRTLALSDGSSVTADRILIGTGSEIAWPEVPGLREARPWTSDDVLELDFLPESVLVLGGGVVACELAQFLRRMGSHVVQIQRSGQLLTGHSPEASAVIARAFREEGVELFTGTRLTRVDFDGAEFVATFEHGGEVLTRRARHCLNALGRTPSTRSLGLEAAGIATLPSGHIVTHGCQQTSVEGVYAAGDCSGPHEIVHVAIQQAETAVRHAFGRAAEPVDHDQLLQVVFTDPQLATAGRARRDLEREGVAHLAASYPYHDHGKSILMEAHLGHVEVVADPATGRLLGAEIVGRDAGELIHVFSIAIAAGLTAERLLRAPWFHPTLAEVLTYPLEEIEERRSRDQGAAAARSAAGRSSDPS